MKRTVLMGVLITILGTQIIYSDTSSQSNPALAPNKNVSHYHVTPYHNEYGSGYETETHILKKEEKFVSKRFTPDILSEFVVLMNQLRALSYYEKWQASQKITPQGSVLVDEIILGPDIFFKGEYITLKSLEYWTNSIYTANDFYNDLIQENILTDDGYIGHLSNEIDSELSSIDFTNLKKAIQSYSFKFNDNAINKQLKKEFFSFLKESSTIIDITQQKTTRYQSRKLNFWDAFVDNIWGNMLGSIFFKDKVKTESHEREWIGSTTIKQFFPNYYLGFANNVYDRNLNGPSVLLGNKRIKEVSVRHSSQEGNSLTNVGFQIRSISAKNSSVHSGNFGTIKANYMNLQHGEDGMFKNEYYQLSIGGGSIGQKHISELYTGLTFNRTDGETYLGANLGFNYEWFVIKPLSLYFESVTHFHVRDWALNQLDIGSSIYIGPAKISGGYQWNVNANLDTLLNQFYIKGSFYL